MRCLPLSFLAMLFLTTATSVMAQSRPILPVRTSNATRPLGVPPRTPHAPAVPTRTVLGHQHEAAVGAPAEPFRESISITRQVIAALDAQIQVLEAENSQRLAATVAPAQQLRRHRRDLSGWRALKCIGAICLAPATGGASLFVGGVLAAHDTNRLNATDRDIRANDRRRTEIEQQIAHHRQQKSLLQQQLGHLQAAERILNSRLPAEPPRTVDEAAEQLQVSQELLTNLRGQSGHLTTIRNSAATVGVSIDAYAAQLQRAVSAAEQRVARSQRELIAVISIAASANPGIASARFLERQFISLVSHAMTAGGLGEPFARLLAETLVTSEIPNASQIRDALVGELVAHAHARP